MKTQHLFVSLLLLCTLFFSFAVPKTKYENPGLVKQIALPERLKNWQSRNVAKELNLTDARYNFASNIWARVYGTQDAQSLLFLIVDSDNFHPPKACFQSSGFQIHELDDILLTLPAQRIYTKAIFAEKNGNGFLVLYWTCVNKQAGSDLLKGDVEQFWFNLLNKNRAGLMIRLDIPATKESLAQGRELAQKFLNDLAAGLNEAQAEYIFGYRTQ